MPEINDNEKQNNSSSSYNPPIPQSDVQNLTSDLLAKAEKKLSIKAGENLSAGDIVKIERISGEPVALKIRDNNSNFYDSFVTAGTGTSWSSFQIYKLDSDRLVVVGISANSLYCRIYNITTKTWGTSIQIDTSTVSLVSGCVNTTDNVIVVAWVKSSIAYTRLLTWSGETLTAQGTNQRINGTATTVPVSSLAYVPTANKIVCLYNDGTSNYTISGTINTGTWQVTWDDAYKHNPVIGFTNSATVCYVPVIDRVFVLGKWSPYTRMSIYRFDTGNLTPITGQDVGNITYSYERAISIGNNRVMFTGWREEAVTIRIYTIGESTITLDYITTLVDYTGASFITSVYNSTEDTIYLIYLDLALCHYIIMPMQFDGTNLHFGLPTVYAYAGSNTGGTFCIDAVEYGNRIVGIQRTRLDSNYNHIVIHSLYDDRMNVFGFVKVGANSGQNAIVVPLGFLDDTRNGLVVGRHYFIGADGNLQTFRTPFYYGKAISSTEIQTCDLTIGRQVL